LVKFDDGGGGRVLVVFRVTFKGEVVDNEIFDTDGCVTLTGVGKV
jgi:hypothetical protein